MSQSFTICYESEGSNVGSVKHVKMQGRGMHVGDIRIVKNRYNKCQQQVNIDWYEHYRLFI